MREVLEQLPVDPRPDDFFDDLWARIHREEHAAVRRWRRVALALAALAVVAVASSAAAVVAARGGAPGVVEGTLSCAAQPRAGLHKLDVLAGVTLPPHGNAPGGPGYVELRTLEKIVANRVVPAIGFNAASTQLFVDRSACRTVHTAVPLEARGLVANGVLTTSYLGELDQTCTLRAARVLVHYRVVFGHAGATSARVAIRAGDARREPLVYLDWRPARIATFLSARCNGPR